MFIRSLHNIVYSYYFDSPELRANEKNERDV